MTRQRTTTPDDARRGGARGSLRADRLEPRQRPHPPHDRGDARAGLLGDDGARLPPQLGRARPALGAQPHARLPGARSGCPLPRRPDDRPDHRGHRRHRSRPGLWRADPGRPARGGLGRAADAAARAPRGRGLPVPLGRARAAPLVRRARRRAGRARRRLRARRRGPEHHLADGGRSRRRPPAGRAPALARASPHRVRRGARALADDRAAPPGLPRRAHGGGRRRRPGTRALRGHVGDATRPHARRSG